MTTKTCGCSTETCGCCEGTQKLTPMPLADRPGLPALRYRVGTHGAFFETMKARLAGLTLEAPGADGQTPEISQPLAGLTTRETNDPAIALLDAWATVAEVLTFYQERIANEGYLRTATERRSVLELARLIGYELRPGVAATVFLAYTLEDKQTDPVEILVGARSQSIPGPDELPQSFETNETWITRGEWNNLQVRLRKPQNITLENALSVNTIYITSLSANLKTGDTLLLVFGEDGAPSVARKVQEAEGQFADQRTAIHLQPVPAAIALATPELVQLVNKMDVLITSSSDGATRRAHERAREILDGTYLGERLAANSWALEIESAADGHIATPVQSAIDAFGKKVEEIIKNLGGSSESKPTDPSEFVQHLLKPRVIQPANSLQLFRKLSSAFRPDSDAGPQLLVNFAPILKETYYKAWENADVNDAKSPLKALYVMRLSVPLFGPATPNKITIDDGTVSQAAWTLDGEDDKSLFLDQAHEAILAESFVLIQKRAFNGVERLVRRVSGAQTMPRAAYGVSAKTTQLAFETAWWKGQQDQIETLRGTLVYGQSEELTLAEEPILGNVQGTEIELAGLFKELTSGRWVILSGERADIPNVSGVNASELHMISGLRHDYDPNLPGDKTHTTLLLATGTAYTYKRNSLIIYGNVLKATHGETRNETLGSGDGSQPLQSFVLKQPPLTFVPAPTASGVESTLHVFVNDVEWHETDTLAGLGQKDRNFITKTADNGLIAVVFGNGEEGSRLPTGAENIRAVYRNGIGKGGNVRASQISMLQTRPLGVKSVINPLPASGGADAENRDQARDNAPLAVAALDRLVGLQDYADFTRTFAGIAKADARRLSDGKRELVYITIAGADDISIDSDSDLYRNLLTALRRFGDEALPVQVSMRELVVLALSANVRLSPDYLWEPVVAAIRLALLDTFGFQKRALGQPALLCEIIAAIQNVDGVAYVDVDAFGGIPEKRADVDENNKPIRRLLTLDELSATVQAIVDPPGFDEDAPAGPANRVEAIAADFDLSGGLRPTQLTILTDTVPDTLILNQIK
jgi:predicted phage baseplate assembly protein